MRRRMLKSKIHRATVTDADLDQVGSISFDPALMDAADILEHEQVAVPDIDDGDIDDGDIDNGNRVETCAITGVPGQVCCNGAAARLVHPGDKVIILTYAEYEDAELEDHAPVIVHVDQWNRAVSVPTPAPSALP